MYKSKNINFVKKIKTAKRKKETATSNKTSIVLLNRQLTIELGPIPCAILEGKGQHTIFICAHFGKFCANFNLSYHSKKNENKRLMFNVSRKNTKVLTYIICMMFLMC